MNRTEHKPGALTFNGKQTVFRSHLEARWALFFDRRGMAWDYEPFKFPVQRGGTYTPDFRVEGIGIIEVKPTLDHLAESVDRIEQYVEKTGERVYLLYGRSPFNAGVMILTKTPLMAYRTDDMQRVVVLAGKQARDIVAEHYHACRQSIHQTLKLVSGHVEFDPLTVGQMLAPMEADKTAEARGKAIVRPILSKQFMERAA